MRWIVACAAAVMATSAPAGAAPDDTEQAAAILARTKAAQATYAVYSWNRITVPDEAPVEEWSAEFHHGDLHRVETPRDRVVADCRAGTGWAVSLVSGAFNHGPQVAAAACGINTNAMIAELALLGPVSTPFGPAERVRIIDAQHVREYDVSPEGILLGTTYVQHAPGGQQLISVRAFRVERRLPDSAMFDPASLGRSFVPEALRQKP